MTHRPDAETTSGDVDILHHLGIVATDMNATIQRYERLGFRFTPLSLPQIQLAPGAAPEPVGVGNRCAIFEENYLEVLAIVSKERWSAITPAQRGPFDIDRPLRRYEGMHVLHFGADDIDVTHRRLRAQGTAASDVRPYQRPVDTLEGTALMRARCVSFPAHANPEALVQIAQHVTPELVLQPRYMSHPNGARGIVEVIVCSEDAASLAAKYALYTGRTAQRRDAVHVVELGRSRVVVADPADLGSELPGFAPPTTPHISGFVVRVDALARTREHLDRENVAFRVHRNRLMIDAGDAGGVTLLFEEGDAR